MPKHLYVVFSQPVEGRETEYDEWYAGHLEALLREAGFHAAQRFRLVGSNPPSSAAPAPFLAIYEIDTDDVEAVNVAITEAASAGTLPLSPALDLRKVTGLWFEEISPRVEQR